MITLKVTENELTMECDGVKDFKDITNNENLKRIKDFASTYHNEVVKPKSELDLENAKKISEIDINQTKIKNDHDMKILSTNEYLTAKRDRRRVVGDILRKTGTAVGVSGVIIGALKLAQKVLGTPSFSIESYELDGSEEKKPAVADKTSEKKKK